MKLSKSQILALIFGYTSYYLNCVSISSPAPFLPRQNELHGQGSAVTGIMLGLNPFVQCIFHILWGRMILRLGLRNILVGGMCASSITTAVFGTIQFIPATYPVLYCACGFTIRVLQGIAISAAFISSMTFITALFPDHTTLVLSVLGSIGGVGMISGPAIGSGLFKLGGFWLVFVGIGGLMFTHFITMLIWLPKYDAQQVEQPDSSIPYRKLLLNPRMIVSLLIGLFSAAKWAAIDPILEPRLRSQYGLSQETSALTFLILSGAYVITTPIAGKTVGKPYCMDSLMVMLAGITLSTVIFLFAGPSPLLHLEYDSLWLLLLCLALMGLTNCLLYVPAQDIVFNIEKLDLPAETNRTALRGFISGVWTTSYSLGTALGMFFSGVVMEFTDWPWTLTAYAIGSLLFIVTIIVIKSREILIQHERRKKKWIQLPTYSES